MARAQTDVLGKLVAGLKGQLPGGHEKSIVATLLKSAELLGEQGLSLLRLACELRAGTPIPYTLAKATFGYAFSLGAPEAEAYLLNAINQLETNSLATLALGGTAGDALSVHALVRYTMQHGDPGKDEAAGQRQALREAAVSALDDLLREAEDIRKHVALEWEVGHAQHLAGDPRTLREAGLCERLGRYESERGNYREARSITEKAVLIFAQLLGKDHPETLEIRNNTAFRIGQTGDAREALRLLHDLLSDTKRVRGKDHPDTLAARHNIAFWTGETGDAGEALRLAQDLLPDQERVLGKDHPQTLGTRHNIANWTGETGDAREALRLAQDLLQDHELVLGKDHPQTLGNRHDIANWSGETGDADEALQLFQDLLPDHEQVLGKDTTQTHSEPVTTSLAGLGRQATQVRQCGCSMTSCRTYSGCWGRTIRKRSEPASTSLS